MAWTNETKHDMDPDFLLQEDTYYILLEDGFKILLDQSVVWDFLNKN
jgi:hypothetical protein